MKKQETLEFSINTAGFLREVVECALRENQGVLKIPIQIFQNLLGRVVQRAAELNDPELNILMLRMWLYEVPPHEINKQIEEQKKRIKK